MLDIENVIGTLVIGGAGWWLAHYVGAPVLALRQLRQEIHEELFFTKNIGWASADGKITALEKDRHDRATLDLRRLAAKMSALSITWPRYLSCYLRIRDFDLDKSIGG